MGISDKNPPAFPLGYPHSSGANAGMSLRDYFAGQALTGLIAAADVNTPPSMIPDVARCAYRLADAMLAKRAKGDQK